MPLISTERNFGWNRVLSFVGLFFLAFITNNIFFGELLKDYSYIWKIFDDINPDPNTFIGDVKVSVSDQISQLRNEFDINSIVSIIVPIPYMVFVIIAAKRMAMKKPGDSLIEPLPATPRRFVRFYGVRLWVYIVIGSALNYYTWLYSQVYSHLVSIKSLLDTSFSNAQFLPVVGFDAVRHGQYVLTFNVSLTFLVYLGLIVSSCILLAMFVWSFVQYLHYKKAAAELI